VGDKDEMRKLFEKLADYEEDLNTEHVKKLCAEYKDERAPFRVS
jgi:hypothetical protein